MIDAKKLSALLIRKEDLTIEFKLKYKLDGQGKQQILDEIAKDIVSLVNSNTKRDQGSSFLIIGAGDKLRSDGSRERENVSGQYSADQFLKIINERVSPPITKIEYAEIAANENIYGVIEIPFSPYLHQITRDLSTPHGLWRKGSIIVRHKDVSGIATPEEIKEIAALKSYKSTYILIAALSSCSIFLLLVVVLAIFARGKRGNDRDTRNIEEATPKISPVKIVSSRKGAISKRGKPAPLVFQSKILNPNRIAVDVIKISIVAHIPPYQEFGCGEPPAEFFEISDQISLSGIHDGKNISLAMDYKDKNSSRSTLFRAYGKAVVDGCMGEGSLSLSLDTMFKIQADATIVVTIQIPSKFTIIKKGIWTPDDPQKRAEYVKILKEEGHDINEEANLEKIKNGLTSRLDKWKFCFLLTDGTSTCSKEV